MMNACNCTHTCKGYNCVCFVEKLKSQALIWQIPVQNSIQTRQYTVQSAFLPRIIAENVRALFSMCNWKQYIHIKCTQSLCCSLHRCRCSIIAHTTPPVGEIPGFQWVPREKNVLRRVTTGRQTVSLWKSCYMLTLVSHCAETRDSFIVKACRDTWRLIYYLARHSGQPSGKSIKNKKSMRTKKERRVKGCPLLPLFFQSPLPQKVKREIWVALW